MPVGWPFGPGCSPEVALVISGPASSAGPGMYLVLPSCEQVTMGLVGSSTMSWMALGLAQFRAVNVFSMSGVTHARSLASLGLAVGAVAGAVALGLGVTFGFAVGLPVGAAVLAAARARGRPDLGADVVLLVALPVVFVLLVGLVVGLPVAVPVGAGTGSGAAEPSTRTARTRSCEDFCSEAMVAESGVPGSE